MSERACIICCGPMEHKPLHAKLCGSKECAATHRRNEARKPRQEPVERLCGYCKCDISDMRGNARFCSKLCGNQWRYHDDPEHFNKPNRDLRAQERATRDDKACPTCGVTFPGDTRREYCSLRCRQASRREARTLEYRAWAARNPERRAEINSEWRATNPLKGKEYGAARRALEYGNPGFVRFTDRDIARLLNRFGHRCAYCGSDGGGHPLELDHVIPLARGGRHAIANMQPACKRCNISKHKRFLSEWKYSGLAPTGAFVI